MEAENHHSPASLKFCLGCLVSKKTEPGIQPAGGSCFVGQVPIEHINRLGFIFSELLASVCVVLYSTMGTVQRKANFSLLRMFSRVPSPAWHTPPRPGLLLQPETASGNYLRGERRRSHAVLSKEPEEVISCGFGAHFHIVACSVNMLGNHRS